MLLGFFGCLARGVLGYFSTVEIAEALGQGGALVVRQLVGQLVRLNGFLLLLVGLHNVMYPVFL